MHELVGDAESLNMVKGAVRKKADYIICKTKNIITIGEKSRMSRRKVIYFSTWYRMKDYITDVHIINYMIIFFLNSKLLRPSEKISKIVITSKTIKI